MTDTNTVHGGAVAWLDAARRLILAADSYGVRYLDSDDMSEEAEELQAATEAMKDIVQAPPQTDTDAREKVVEDAKARIRSEINAPLTGPTHGAWDRGRIAGLKEAVSILAALKTGDA